MLGGVDSIVIPVVCAVVEFGIKGNEREVEAKLDKPSLPATILFNDRQIQGHHQGLRARSEGKRSTKSLGTLRYKVEASGKGEFNSPEIAYVGNFYRGKFHDLSGDAKCSIGSTQRFTGGFEDGHLSGPGVMENFIDGEWRVGFRGTWKMSRPHTGTHFDSANNPMMTVNEGIMTSVGGTAKVPVAVRPPASIPADRMPHVALVQESLSNDVRPADLADRPFVSSSFDRGRVDGSASLGGSVSAVSEVQHSLLIPTGRLRQRTDKRVISRTIGVTIVLTFIVVLLSISLYNIERGGICNVGDEDCPSEGLYRIGGLQFSNICTAIWFSFVVSTTSGFGDIVSVTTAGTFLTVCLIVCGIFYMAMPLTAAASSFNAVGVVQHHHQFTLDSLYKQLIGAAAPVEHTVRKYGVDSGDKRPARDITALIQRMLANSHLSLSLEDSLAVLTQCVELGSANAQRMSGRTAVMVVGNTGAGKSTFLNFLAGCTMESKSARSLGIKGTVGNVVVVKPVPEGGRRDELVKIGHGKISQTFLPNVLIDDETELCFCDCPGFLDNRGAEINIANAVNLITTLSQAKEVKVIILISYKTVEADRGRGLSELITVCTKLFGSVDKLKQHLRCLLIGCSLFDPNSSVDELKEALLYEAPPIMTDLVERLFLVDVLASHEGWWDREKCIEQIRSMPAIANPADVFHTVLLDSDEKKLISIGMKIGRRIEKSLLKADYSNSHSFFRILQQLSAIKHITVERILHDCRLSICKHFINESTSMKEHCHLSAFAEAEQVLTRLQSAAAVFHDEEWADVVPFDQLCLFYGRAQTKHAEQLQRDQALQLRLRQAGNQIDLLAAALEASKQEAIRKENELIKRFQIMERDVAKKLENSEVLFQASQQALQEELSARLLAKEEETKLAYELRQQDEIDRLTAEKQAIEDEYRQQLESSKRKYEADLRAQTEKEQASLVGQQRLLEEARKEKQAAEKRINDLQDQNAAKDTRKLQAADARQQQEHAATAVALLSQVTLLDIANSGDARLLQQLDVLGALGSLPDINQLHVFMPPGWPATSMTALMIASCLGHTAVVQVMLKVPGVDVNLQDDQNGLTTLMWASYNGHLGAVLALLADARVMVNILHKSGRTALYYAMIQERTTIIRLLQAKGAV